MADEFRRKAEQQDKELYEVARDAAKVAQREGHAQVQAAVEAARLLPGVETEQQRRAPRSSSLCLWTLSFRDGRLETAYIRHAETECDNHDHVAALCRLWACAPPLLMALSGHRLSCGVTSPYHTLSACRAVTASAACLRPLLAHTVAALPAAVAARLSQSRRAVHVCPV